MTTLREAAQQALEALKSVQDHRPNDETNAAVTALRAALAQQTQTPCDIAEDGVCEVIDCCGKPPQRAQEEQPIRAHWMALPEAPKGGGNLPPPLQAEPVAVHQFRKQYCANWYDGHPDHTDGGGPYEERTLYTAPPRREWQSLSEEEIDRWTPEIHPVIRAIETKLKEKNA